MVQDTDNIDLAHVMSAKDGKRVTTASMHQVINAFRKGIMGCIVPDPHAGAFIIMSMS